MLNWKVVGFCDSKDTIWINPKLKKEFNAIVFLDIYLANPSFKCIDQHIVAKNLEHTKQLSLNMNKQNPNLEWYRYASNDSADNMSYAWKYPFGTVHYVIACLESLGYEIDISNSNFINVHTYDLILRADDAARSTARNYRENALEWWDWLKELGGNQTTILAKYCCELDFDHAQNSYDELADVFKTKFKSHTNDGNFSKYFKKNNSINDPIITSYLDSVSESLGLPSLNIDDNFNIYKGNFKVESTHNKSDIDGLLKNENLFSYAYTYCMGRLASRGFSYTLGPMQKQ